ncbi:hypothetical protein [Streptomyces canus]|uniref:hypothetical protein n=1 Tax=Streptomyces canus TaxID=58343 RepID=UPI002DD93B27|nr:hypothetical protein [Streptomyces canus]WSD83359.1 hypothetical protein OG925_03190 [Streptomyces canus]
MPAGSRPTGRSPTSARSRSTKPRRAAWHFTRTIAAGKKIKIAMVFDDTPPVWDAVSVRAAATGH